MKNITNTLDTLAKNHNKLVDDMNKNECKICQGSGEMKVANGRDDFDIEECFCTIAFGYHKTKGSEDMKLQDIMYDSVK